MEKKSRSTGLYSLQSSKYKLGKTTTATDQCYTGFQTILTENHAYRSLGRRRGNIGGPWVSHKMTYDLGTPVTLEYWNTPTNLYERTTSLMLPPGFPLTALRTRSPHIPGTVEFDSDMTGASDLSTSDSSMDALGAQLVSMSRPNDPVVDMANNMAEFLSERKFFALPGRELRQGNVGGEYLNYMFGVAPTVGMAKDLRTAMLEKETILAQFERDRGRQIRRSQSLEPETSSSSQTLTNRSPIFWGLTPTGTIMYQPGTATTRTYERIETWFEGAFTYWYPDKGIGKKIAELDRLYGVVPNVDTAWELLPFSWLADYKLSMGAAVSNMAAFGQGLVMNYGYVMRKRVVETIYGWSGNVRMGDATWIPLTIEARTKFESQQRVRANPFGFGVLPGSLSAKQLSILAALGLSSARNR